jgi:diketogulonate reductase-like aldo/keto reductase
MMKLLPVQTENMPALGFGTWRLSGDECVRAVDFALNNDYRHIDTAQIYENEAEVGDGIKKSGVARENIFLTTKVWRDNFTGKRVMESVEESLKKLKTDYVDLLLVHWPFPEVSIKELVEGVMEAQVEDKARLIGVSNFTVAQMAEAQKISGGKICNNQVEYHPFLSQKPVLDYTQKNDMILTAYSPVARGKAISDPTLKEIGLKYGKSAGQVTLRWLTQQDRVAAIPKSATPENIKANMAIFDFELSEEDMKKISSLASPNGRLINPEFAPKWDQAA